MAIAQVANAKLVERVSASQPKSQGASARGNPATIEMKPIPLARLAARARPANAKMHGMTQAVPKPMNAKANTLVENFRDSPVAAKPAAATTRDRSSGRSRQIAR